MKRTLTQTISAAALLGAAWAAPAMGAPVDEVHPALRPLGQAPLQMAPRRAVEALPCGLFDVGPARPRTAPLVAAEPLLSVQGPTVDRSRRIRALTASIERELALLDGRSVTVQSFAPPRTMALHTPAPVPVDAETIEASRAARAQGPLAIDAEVLRRSRLARAIALR